MKKIINLSVSLLMLSTLACNSVNDISNNKVDEISITGQNNSIDVKKNGADLQIQFDFGTGFETKASSSGTAASTVADIQSAKIYLVTSNTDPLAAGNISATSGTLTFSGPTHTYTIANVPPGTYYAAVELFSDAAATTNIIETINYGGSTGVRGLTVSSNSSTVAVGSTFSFSDSSTSFKIAPALKNATGVTLEADVTPTNGNTTPSGTISIS